MEKIIQNSHNDLTFRNPVLDDGYAIYQLIKACPPLDLNSSYLYFLQASHFADTCIIVEQDGLIIGFLSAYYQPDKPQTLFVWQVAIAESARGRGLAKAMLLALLKCQPKDSQMTELGCTISPSNKASQGLFSSFAKKHGLILQTSPFINEAHFGEENHEAEDLYILKAADNTKLIPYFS
ncbi:MAG: L-2,4-diaminobutyric acid acetyltransferase [Methylophagaceae bacterium]|jgi:L-2,4-diaminobutyric acid acetyltransferase